MPKAPISFLCGMLAIAGCAQQSALSVESENSEAGRPALEAAQFDDGRIYGGRPAVRGQFPWMIFLLSGAQNLPEKREICGGILLSKRWVLTAAHCMPDGRGPRYIVGAADVVSVINLEIVQPLNFKALHCHNKYQGTECSPGSGQNADDEPKAYDLALLELDEASQARVANLKPLGLLPAVQHQAASRADQVGKIAGWGATENAPSSSYLRWAPIQIVAREVCSAAPSHIGKITPDMICAGPAAGGTGVCLGDSGGPLFVETPDGPRLIGVASWTIAQNGRCLRPGAFSVFAQATADDDWLSRMLAEN